MAAASIRRAEPGDAGECCRIHLASRAAAMPWLAVDHSPEETLDWFQNHALRHMECWVAEREGAVVGYLALDRDFVSHLYIDPLCQRAGIGTQLLRHAQLLRPSGFRLYVFQRNQNARRFYERHGCRLMTLSDGAMNEEREPDALYVWP